MSERAARIAEAYAASQQNPPDDIVRDVAASFTRNPRVALVSCVAATAKRIAAAIRASGTMSEELETLRERLLRDSSCMDGCGCELCDAARHRLAAFESAAKREGVREGIAALRARVSVIRESLWQPNGTMAPFDSGTINGYECAVDLLNALAEEGTP